MTAKAKIEGLTNSWYGFAVFSAMYSIVTNGFGVLRILLAVSGLLFSWFLTFLLGRALVRKSSLTRVLLVVISGIAMVMGTLAAGRSTLAFVQHWELSVLLTALYSVASTWMNAKSFRTLTDSSVKAYFG